MFWMAFWVAMAFTVVGELIRPKPKPQDAQPASIDDFQFPTVSETRNWPWLVGECLVEGGNLTWYGDLRTVPVTKKVKTGLFSKKRVVVANKYYIGMEIFLCVNEIDDIVAVRFGGETTTKFTKSVTADSILFTFNDPNMFGGDEKDGGVQGTLRIARGTMTQNSNSYIQTVLGRTRSAYRGLCYAAFERFYVGTRENIRPISFVVRRLPNTLGLSGGHHAINGDSNPICAIYELLTDSRWGGDVAETEIDTASFIAVAETIYAEGLGVSMLNNTARSAKDLIADILRHIDGVMYTDNETGLLTLALARADYVASALPEYGPSDIDTLSYSRGSWSETKNTFMVTFIDRAQDFTERTIPLRDTANIQGRDGVVDADEIPFLGFSNGTNALKRGAVAAKTLSYPLLNAKIVMNGRGWKLRPGSVFRLNWPEDGIEGLVLRVSRINYGDIQRNRIELDCVEDIFAVSNVAFVVPPPSNWVNPVSLPSPLVAQYAFEAPFHVIGDGNRYIGSFGSRFSGIDEGYQAWHDPAGGTAYVLGNINYGFTPTGVISLPYPANTGAIDTVGFVMSSPRDVDDVVFSASNDEVTFGDSLAVIRSSAGEEWIAYKTVTNNGNGTYTISNVWRGVLDTVELDHPAGARVWFYSHGAGFFSETPYGSNLTINGRLLPFNAKGLLPIADATTLSVTLTQRAAKPYPAGNVKINNVTYLTTTVGNAVLTWSRRHRLEQYVADRIVAQNETDFSANVEGTYTVRVYTGGTLRQTFPNSTSPFTYTAAQRIAHDSNGLNTTRLVIEPVNGSLTGTTQERTFTMTGFGMTFGQYFGGIQG